MQVPFCCFPSFCTLPFSHSPLFFFLNASKNHYAERSLFSFFHGLLFSSVSDRYERIEICTKHQRAMLYWHGAKSVQQFSHVCLCFLRLPFVTINFFFSFSLSIYILLLFAFAFNIFKQKWIKKREKVPNVLCGAAQILLEFISHKKYGCDYKKQSEKSILLLLTNSMALVKGFQLLFSGKVKKTMFAVQLPHPQVDNSMNTQISIVYSRDRYRSSGILAVSSHLCSNFLFLYHEKVVCVFSKSQTTNENKVTPTDNVFALSHSVYLSFSKKKIDSVFQSCIRYTTLLNIH